MRKTARRQRGPGQQCVLQTARAEERPAAADLLDEARTRLLGLFEAELLLDRIHRSRSKRLRADRATPRSAAERHVRETGHELAHGCCRERMRAEPLEPQ